MHCESPASSKPRVQKQFQLCLHNDMFGTLADKSSTECLKSQLLHLYGSTPSNSSPGLHISPYRLLSQGNSRICPYWRRFHRYLGPVPSVTATLWLLLLPTMIETHLLIPKQLHSYLAQLFYLGHNDSADILKTLD